MVERSEKGKGEGREAAVGGEEEAHSRKSTRKEEVAKSFRIKSRRCSSPQTFKIISPIAAAEKNESGLLLLLLLLLLL